MLSHDPKKLSSSRTVESLPDHASVSSGTPGEVDPGTVSGAAPAALSAAPGLGNLMHALRRSWKLVVPIALAGAALAAGVAWFALSGQYASILVFRINSRPAHGSLEDETNFANVQKAQVAFMKSHEVLAETIEKSRIAERFGVRFTPQSLQKKLVTHFNDGPEMLNVQLMGSNPEALAVLLDTLAEVYPRKVQTRDEERVRARIAQLRRRLLPGTGNAEGRTPTLAEQLRDKRLELHQAEQKAGLNDVDSLNLQYQSAMNMLQGAQRDLRDKASYLAGLEGELAAKIERLKKPQTPVISELDAEESLRNDFDFLEITRQITGVKKQIDDVRRVAQASAREKLLRKPMVDLAKFESERRTLIEDARERLARKRQVEQIEEDRKTINQLRDKLEQTRKHEAALRQEERRWMIAVENFRAGGPKAPPEVEALRDQVKQLQKEYARVGDDLASLEGSLPLRPRVTVVAPAYVPSEPDLARPAKYSVAAGAGMFGLLLAGLCLLEARGRRIAASDEVSTGLGLPVIGSLPLLPKAARGKTLAACTIGGLDSQFGMTEAVDAIRTVLLHAPQVDGARIVMITSAMGGEGKTTLASQLAASLARAWRKTLLIDGDLRNPAQNVQFDLPAEPGLCEALRGEVELEDTIKPTLISRLWLMPAGSVDAHALEALTQDNLALALQHLQDQYEFIVLDTSPVLPVPDALMLGKMADAVLLSVMRDVSRLPAVYQAYQKLESLGIRVLGSVIIGEKTELYGRAVPYPKRPG